MSKKDNEEINEDLHPDQPESQEDEIEEGEQSEPPVEEEEDEPQSEDIGFDEELERLEAGDEEEEKLPPKKPARTELEKAYYALKMARKSSKSVKSIIKRIKELGGTVPEEEGELPIEDEIEEGESPKGDFVTKQELILLEAEKEVKKLAKSPGEYKLMMWYVKNKGLEPEQAHLLANREKIKTNMNELKRKNELDSTPAGHGSGGGQRPPVSTVPELSPKAKESMSRAGMVFDSKERAYVGTRVKMQWNGKQWISFRKESGVWKAIPKASDF